MYEKIKKTLKDAKTAQEVYKLLNDMDVKYRDKSKESGYLNLEIREGDGVIRVYRRRTKEIIVQKWTKQRLEYSGVPTFMPGGRDTFARYF